jgi:hypothetical protein
LKKCQAASEKLSVEITDGDWANEFYVKISHGIFGVADLTLNLASAKAVYEKLGEAIAGVEA